MKRIYYIITLMAALAACSDDLPMQGLDKKQQQLLGRAVNFDASVADAFESRASYNHDGQFNQGDLMKIFRQYSDDGGKTFNQIPVTYRLYYYKPIYVGGSTIVIPNGWQWHVKAGKTGCEEGEYFTQTEADSLSWENGNSVRFFASSLSNLAGALDSDNWNRYYPDFMMSNMVSTSGPTENVAFTMRHLGCRIGFAPKNSGNQIAKVEICLDWEDYKRKDNAGSAADDAAEIISDDEAKMYAENVKSAYYRMCMPGGLDLVNSRLNALTKAYVNGGGKVSDLYLDESQEKMVILGQKTMEEIKNEVVRPKFVPNDNRFYMISIPHDMSSDFSEKGALITLPSCTRFKVWLRDVNSGDTSSGDNMENSYHIFSLMDVKDGDGMTLYAGYSYLFRVGYHYDRFTVEIDPSFSWAEQDVQGSEFEENTGTKPDARDFGWWTRAIDTAIDQAVNYNKQYNPEFIINSKEEFITFLKLVNGTAHENTGTLKRAYRTDKNNPDNGLKYWWYDPDNLRDANGDTLWVSHADAEQEGFVFYKRYNPSDGDKPAYISEEYLSGPYSFYSDIVKRHFAVNLACDLDFDDCEISAIGSAVSPFKGYFNGGMHTVSNFRVEGNYLFANIEGGSITNLKLKSNYTVGLLNEGKETHIAGIDIEAPSPAGASIAVKLTGTDAKSPSYVVGCTHRSRSLSDGKAPLVGEGNHLRMWGCMNTVSGIAGGALLGKYAAGADAFFAPQPKADEVAWGNIMCCYYDTQCSPGANAVDDITDSYLYNEYVRGRLTHVLCAKNDNMIELGIYDKLTDPNQKADFYGVAPWRAMNCAIDRYNTTAVGRLYPCKAHYEEDSNGYTMLYPTLEPGVPTAEQMRNILK